MPTPSDLRTASGAPGHRYWQQRADYAIDVELDTARNGIRGQATVTYTNRSPDPLPYFWIHLEQNLFRKGSLGSGRRTRARGVSTRADRRRSGTTSKASRHPPASPYRFPSTTRSAASIFFVARRAERRQDDVQDRLAFPHPR
jgi:hypothetical protein